MNGVSTPLSPHRTWSEGEPLGSFLLLLPQPPRHTRKVFRVFHHLSHDRTGQNRRKKGSLHISTCCFLQYKHKVSYKYSSTLFTQQSV